MLSIISSIIGWTIRVSVIAAVVLIGSHFVTWRGKTVSDQVKAHLSHAERLPAVRQTTKKVKGWIGSEYDEDTDELRHSERQKLRSLITELGGASADSQTRE